MIDATTQWLGPLAGPECRRASRRGWLIWVRLLPAIAAGAVAFVALWVGEIGRAIDADHLPFAENRYALELIEGMILACGMILTPAVLAGSLAGEKERGSIGLLLTTRVNSLDVVLGRLAGRLSQVLLIELAAVPVLLFFTTYSGLGWSATLMAVALPMAVSFGGGGIALAASAMSRRGRDALLLVYLIYVLFLLSPLVGPSGPGWVGHLSPFEPLAALTWGEQAGPAATTALAWTSLGLAGLALAAWRLRPSCLAEGPEAAGRKKARRKGWVPPIDDRPMLWKELYIERVGTLGRAGRWIGSGLVAWLVVGSLALAGVAAWDDFSGSDGSWTTWAVERQSAWYGRSSRPIAFLIVWAIGLRAAVAIASERERGTWDALLTSPLEGSEIVRGKLWGSLYALRWLIGSAVLAWGFAAAMGGLLVGEFVELIAGLVSVGTFMAAVGVRMSLRSATATRAMGATMGVWLGAYLLAKATAAVACVAVAIACVFGWLYSIQLGMVSYQSTPWFPMSFRLGSEIVFNGLFVASTILIVIETRLRFDRAAGRMTGGTAAVAVEQLIHGRPMAPVRAKAPEGARREAEAVERVG